MKIFVQVILLTWLLPLIGCSLPNITLFPRSDAPLKEVTLQGSGDDKILVISVEGIISHKPKEKLLRSYPSMVQKIVSQLRRAEQDPQIKALILKIDSPGGSVTASDILYHEIVAYKQRTNVKVVAAMMNIAASGGYYIALPADWIVAHPTTVTGSIGVIFMRSQVSGFMEKTGLSMEVSKSGEQKDMGSPFRPPTSTENALFQNITDRLAQRFIKLLVQHRSILPAQQEEVTTARIFLADKAKELGLVDQIGYLNDVLVKTRELADLSSDARVITLRRSTYKDDNIYNPAVQAPYGGDADAATLIPPLKAFDQAGFYYLWPAAVGN